MKRTIGFCCIALLFICGSQLWAQDLAPSDFEAQKLVDELLAKHQPELVYVGLYLVPPPRSTAAYWPYSKDSDEGETEMVIVAATDRSTIAQKASCTDLQVLKTDVPVLEMNGNSGTKINGTVSGTTFLAILHDRKGDSIGVLEIGMKFTTGEESEAAKFAKSVQQELEAKIPTKMAIFQHAQ